MPMCVISLQPARRVSEEFFTKDEAENVRRTGLFAQRGNFEEKQRRCKSGDNPGNSVFYRGKREKRDKKG